MKKEHKFSVHPVSILMWLWLFFVLGPMVFLGYFFAVLVHEFGHYFVAKKLGYQLSKFSLSPYGVSLSYYEQNLNYKDEIKIAIAGPLANLLSSLFVVALWWIFPTIFFFTGDFVKISVLLALVNLLPAYPLDGGRLFVCLSSFFIDKKAKKITMIFNAIFGTFFLFVFVVCCFVNFNPSYFLFAFFLFVGMLDLKENSKYEKINIFCKNKKNFVKPDVCCVYCDVTIGELLKKMQTSKTKIFCLILDNGKIINLSEKTIINLSLKYSIDSKLCEIIK